MEQYIVTQLHGWHLTLTLITVTFGVWLLFLSTYCVSHKRKTQVAIAGVVFLIPVLIIFWHIVLVLMSPLVIVAFTMWLGKKLK